MAYVLSLFLPWWSIMVAGFIAGLFIGLKKSAVFFIPFLAVLVLWVVQAYILSSGNDFILGNKIARLLPLNGNVYLLLLVTGIIGGLAAGVASIFGKQVSTILKG